MFPQTPREIQILPFDVSLSQIFGGSTAINQNYLFIGDPGYDNYRGVVFVYKKKDSTWTYLKKIIPPDIQPGDHFGTIYLNDDHLFISSTNKKISGLQRGTVYYYKIENDNFILKQTIQPDLSYRPQKFGNAIYSFEDKLIIGCYYAMPNFYPSGAAFLYKKIDSLYYPEHVFLSKDSIYNQNFGYSVAIDSSAIYIGTPYDDNPSGFMAGAVFVYKKYPSEWTLVQKVVPDNSSDHMSFGHYIILDKEYVYISAPVDLMGDKPGEVYIFKKSEELEKIGKLENLNNKRDSFGGAMAFLNDTLLVSALDDTIIGNQYVGAIYTFRKMNTGEFKLMYRILSSDSSYGFGFTVSLISGWLVSSDPFGKVANKYIGKVYLFSDQITSVELESPAIVGKLYLYQNYPNPFNPVTTIKYLLPESGTVHVKIFDILGREIAILYNGWKQKGEHEFIFNASSYSSGVYIYQIISGTQVRSRKMLLSK